MQLAIFGTKSQPLEPTVDLSGHSETMGLLCTEYTRYKMVIPTYQWLIIMTPRNEHMVIVSLTISYR